MQHGVPRCTVATSRAPASRFVLAVRFRQRHGLFEVHVFGRLNRDEVGGALRGDATREIKFTATVAIDARIIRMHQHSTVFWRRQRKALKGQMLEGRRQSLSKALKGQPLVFFRMPNSVGIFQDENC